MNEDNKNIKPEETPCSSLGDFLCKGDPVWNAMDDEDIDSFVSALDTMYGYDDEGGVDHYTPSIEDDYYTSIEECEYFASSPCWNVGVPASDLEAEALVSKTDEKNNTGGHENA